MMANAITPWLKPTNQESALDQYSLGQKQALINALKQSAMQAQTPQQVGAIASRTSPLSPIIQALTGYLAGKEQKDLNSEYASLAKREGEKAIEMMQPITAPSVTTGPIDESAMGPPAQLANMTTPSAMNPGGMDPKVAAQLYQSLGPAAYSSQYVAPFNKPDKADTFQSTSHGMRFNPKTGEYFDANGKKLSDEDVQARMQGGTWQRKTRTIGNKQQDYDYNPATREEKLVGELYDRPPSAAATAGASNPSAAVTTAELIANGQIPMINGNTLKTPFGQEVVQHLKKIKPDYTANTYPTIAAAEKAFTSGVESRKVRSLNTAIDHLETIDKLGEALKNGNTQAFNQLSNYLAKQTGSPAPTNLETAAQLVGSEVISAIVQGGGGVAEREEAASAFKTAKSPAQLAGVTDTYRKLLGGQMHSLAAQYESGTQKKDFHRRFLNEGTKRALGIESGESAKSDMPDDINKLLQKYK